MVVVLIKSTNLSSIYTHLINANNFLLLKSVTQNKEAIRCQQNIIHPLSVLTPWVPLSKVTDDDGWIYLSNFNNYNILIIPTVSVSVSVQSLYNIYDDNGFISLI